MRSEKALYMVNRRKTILTRGRRVSNKLPLKVLGPLLTLFSVLALPLTAATQATPSNLDWNGIYQGLGNEEALGSYGSSYRMGQPRTSTNINVTGFTDYIETYGRRTTPVGMVPEATAEMNAPTPDQNDKYFHIQSNQDQHRKILINLRMGSFMQTLGEAITEGDLTVEKLSILLVYDFRTNKHDLSDFTDLVWHIGQIQYYNTTPNHWAEYYERMGQTIFDLNNPPPHHDGGYFTWNWIQFDVTNPTYFNKSTGEFYLGMYGRKHSYEHSFYFEIDYVMVTYYFTTPITLPAEYITPTETTMIQPVTVTVTTGSVITATPSEDFPGLEIFSLFLAVSAVSVLFYMLLRRRRI